MNSSESYATTEIQTSPLINAEQPTQIEVPPKRELPYLEVAQRCHVGAIRPRSLVATLNAVGLR